MNRDDKYADDLCYSFPSSSLSCAAAYIESYDLKNDLLLAQRQTSEGYMSISWNERMGWCKLVLNTFLE